MPSKQSHMYSRRTFLAGMAALGAAGLWCPLKAAASAAHYQQTALFMGTIVRMDIASCPQSLAEEACAAAFAEGMRLEGLLTRHRADSPLGVLNSQGSLRDVPAELSALLDMSREIHTLSSGAFDPTVLPVLEALEKNAAADELARVRAKIGFEKIVRDGALRVESGMSVTLDGIAKGYIAQRMSDTLSAAGCANHIVNAGGDIVARGKSPSGAPWHAAIEDPAKQGRYPTALDIADRALATSGIYEKPFASDNGSHLIDPSSPSRLQCASASVLAPTGAQADALATAFSVMPPARSLAAAGRLQGVEALLVMRDGRILRSAGWPA